LAACAAEALELPELDLEAAALLDPPPEDLWLLDFFELLELLVPLLPPGPGFGLVLPAANAVRDMEAISIAAVAIAKNFFMIYLLLPHD